MGFVYNPFTGSFDSTGPGMAVGSGVAGASNNSVLLVDSAGLLDDSGSLTNGQIVIGSTGSIPVAATITGTSNQIVVTNGPGSITLSLPQDIAISSSPTFNGLKLEETGVGTDTITIQAAASISAPFTLTLPTDTGLSGQVLQTDGAGILSWINNGSITVGTIDSQPKVADAGVISGSSLYFQTADASYPGVVSTGAQIFAGTKQFNNYIYADGGIDHSTLGGTLAIGTNNASIINLGNASSTINFNGTVNNNNVTNLVVTDQLITINHGGGAGSASGAGFEIEENALITGYFKTSADRNSFELKAPNTAGVITLTPGVAGFTIDQGSHNPVTVSDTNTINLTLSTQLLSADVVHQNTNSISLSDNASGLKADLNLSSNSADVGYVLVTNDIESTGVVGLRSQVQVSALTSALDSTYVNVSGDTMMGTLVLSDATVPLTLNSAAITATRPLKVDASKNVISTQIDLASSNDVTGLLPIVNQASQPTTFIIHVDKNRVDSYVEDGSITRPYKTIKDATLSVSPSASNKYEFHIAPGAYVEANDFVIKEGMYLVGRERDTVTIKRGDSSDIVVDFTANVSHRAGANDVTFVNGLVVDRTGDTTGGASFDLMNVWLGGGISYVGTGSGFDYLNMKHCYVSGASTLSGISGIINWTSFLSTLTMGTTGAVNADGFGYYALISFDGSYVAGAINATAAAAKPAAYQLFNTNGDGNWSFVGTAPIDLYTDHSGPLMQFNTYTKTNVTTYRYGLLSNVGYIPVTSSDWNSVPDNVQSGLDTLAISGVAKQQTANTVLSGPSSGGPALPTFRALVVSDIPTGIDHNTLANLTVGDPHTQYALLAGRAGGQILIGGTAASNSLVLRSTTDVSKGQVYVDETTSSTSPSTGALRVGGGVGVGENLYVAGVLASTATSNQILLGTTNTTTITSPAPVASRVVTLPDAGTNSSFVLTESAQTINGVKTFGNTPLLKTALDIEDPGVGTNKVTIQAPTLAASYTITLPVDDGTSGQYLQTDGAGVLSWQTVTTIPTIFGSRGTPRDIVAATGVTSGASHMSTTASDQVIFIQGSGGAVTVTASPQIQAHTVTGARMTLIGRSDTNTVTFTNSSGLELQGNITLATGSALVLLWDGTAWGEISRNV